MRAAGRLRERILMLPQLGAGMEVVCTMEVGVEYSLLLYPFRRTRELVKSRNRGDIGVVVNANFPRL